MKNTSFYSVLLIAILLSSCSLRNDEVHTLEMGYEYAPIAENYVWEYQVEDIFLTPTQKDTQRYFLRESVYEKTQFADEEVYIIHRSKRYSANDPWVVDSVWTSRYTRNRYVRAENDDRYIKLIFPLQQGRSWDGNALNVLDPINYTYLTVGKRDTIAGKTYDAIAEVEHFTLTTFISKEDSREIYAKGVGLVYLYKEDTRFQPGDDTLGSIYKQWLVGYEF